jgi:hypothetical protein
MVGKRAASAQLQELPIEHGEEWAERLRRKADNAKRHDGLLDVKERMLVLDRELRGRNSGAQFAAVRRSGRARS